MGAEIHIYCPTGGEGAVRADLEFDLEEFFGEAASITGSGSGVQGYNIDLELADESDWEQWVARLPAFLRQQQVGPGTWFNVFPPDWEPGDPHRRVEVYGG